MPAEKISVEHAKQDKLFYVVATVIVYRESDGRCMILKRHEREKVHPGKWATPGGKLEAGDLDMTNPTRQHNDVTVFDNAIPELAAREVREEAGVEISPELQYNNSMVFVRPDGIPVVMLRFVATYVSGDVKLEEDAFTDHAWVSAEEIDGYDCLGDLAEEIKSAIALQK